MEERLQKILARGGIASRRAAEELILEGRVSVNGRIVTELGTRANPEVDVVAMDGVPVLRSVKHSYIMLHKPPGYVTTRHDPEGRPTVFELVPDIPGLFTVGRLDRETEGLLLLTTDGAWAEQIAHPRYEVEREYEVRIVGPISPNALAWLREGIMLDGKLARPVAAYQSGQNGQSAILTIVILEGRKREVRMLCAAAGLTVKRLIRRRVGSILLGWLAEGHWRNLNQQEVEALRGVSRPARLSSGNREPRSRTRDNIAGGEAEASVSDDMYRNRRARGVGQVDDRPEPGVSSGVPLSRHRRNVSRSDQPRVGPRNRSEG
ncbi:MAG: rluB [Chloroflexi bacterium]|nr:rluB [Chloroflexota bacterium]